MNFMANMKNAKKKIKQIAKKTEENVMLKSTVKNAIKNTDKAVLAGDKKAANKYLKAAIKALDNAKSKCLVNQNKGDREKSPTLRGALHHARGCNDNQRRRIGAGGAYRGRP